MKAIAAAALLMAAVIAPHADGQATAQPQPRIGYVYPAGGRQGTKVEVVAGGELLRGTTGAHVTGGGVRVSTIRYMGRQRNLVSDERTEVLERLPALLERRGIEPPPIVRRFQRRANPSATPTTVQSTHPLIANLENINAIELDFLMSEMLIQDPKRQPNTQIADTVWIDFEIDADAAPGEREVRLVTQAGMTNPLRFHVGLMPEECEAPGYGLRPPVPLPVRPPVLLNGQVKPGEVDRWRISLSRGQKIVIRAYARSLIPHMADAVPGWFQAVITLYDGGGREVAYADDYRYDPDPVLFFDVPETGVYELQIRDAIYRGRLDFVYRVSVAEQPFIESIFPLGARAGTRTVAAVDGWHLSTGRITLDTFGAGSVRQMALPGKGLVSNSVAYAVDDLEEMLDKEPNDSTAQAQPIRRPVIINGRIWPPGDEDVFSFAGSAGEEIVVEVVARRLGSPMDSLIRLMDASGRVVAWNDDHEDRDGVLFRDPTLLTHHADSYLRTTLPADGAYYISVSDAQNAGGAAYVYRLHVRPPKPDFVLALTPSTVNIPAGGHAMLTAHVLRKDGFEGDVEIALRDIAQGFTLSGALIPAGCDSVRMTIGAPPRTSLEPVPLRFEGRATTAGRRIIRPAVACDEMMQAFLYRHLVPSQEMLMVVTPGRNRGAATRLATAGPVRIGAKQDSAVRIELPPRAQGMELEFVLIDGPPGVVLRDRLSAQGGVALVLKADPEKAAPGLRGNLIVEAFTEIPPTQGGPGRRVSLGFLPAIPFEIMEPAGAAP